MMYERVLSKQVSHLCDVYLLLNKSQYAHYQAFSPGRSYLRNNGYASDKVPTIALVTRTLPVALLAYLSLNVR